MIKAIIIEDQPNCTTRLKRLIKECETNIEVIEEYDNIDDAISGTQKLNPDLVFLDIEVKDKTGFEYLEALENHDFNLIFTTGYSQFATRAFKFSALDYLLKPIDKEDFEDAIKRYNQRIVNSYNSLKIKSLLDNKNKKKQNKELYFESSGRLDKIVVKDILYIKKESNFVTLKTLEKEINLNNSLSYYEDLLKDFYFFRNHSNLINLKNINSYERYGSQIKVTLKSEESFEISTRRKKKFLKAFEAVRL